MEKYLFFGLSALAICSAIMMLVSKKPIHSLLYLVLCFFALSGHYLLLNAQFLAVVNIIVYAGAIMVLFLFTVMLLNLNILGEMAKTKVAQVTAVVSGGILLVALTGVLKGIDTGKVTTVSSQMGVIRNIGEVLFNKYVFPFEIASILFLTAMVGAVMMIKNEK